MSKHEFIKTRIDESITIKQKLIEQNDNIIKISEMISNCLKNNSTLFLCGNGGSASDAQHIAAEFVGRFNIERRPLPAEALTTNTSIITAIGNDYSFDEIFSRQVNARMTNSDILVGISTSGKSRNVLLALETARKNGSATIGFTGKNIQMMEKICDVCLSVPSDKTPRIQEAHILAWHIICDLVEKSLFGNNQK